MASSFFQTSASLKFTVLNPKGRIWTMVVGGGASVIYANTVGDLGYASELGNYAEYSGAPNEEVLQYARVVLDCATTDPDGRKRALLVGFSATFSATAPCRCPQRSVFLSAQLQPQEQGKMSPSLARFTPNLRTRT